MSISADIDAVERRIERIASERSAGAASGPAPRALAATEPHAFGSLVTRAYEDLARRGAIAAGVDPALVAAVAKTESGFDPRATSATGAGGLMQLMPATAKSLGVADPYDPVQNVCGGAVYLHRLLERFHASVPLAVAAYNAGPGAVEHYGGIPPFDETREYVRRVMAAYRAGGGR